MGKPLTTPSFVKALHTTLMERNWPPDEEIPLKHFAGMISLGKGIGYAASIVIIKEGERLGLWSRENRNPFPSIIKLSPEDDSLASAYRQLIEAERSEALLA